MTSRFKKLKTEVLEKRQKKLEQNQRIREEARRRLLLRRGKLIPVALDAMGTDHGPEEIIDGAWGALEKHPYLEVVLTGPQERLERIIRAKGYDHPRLRIENATEVVAMHEAPKDALKKQDSTVSVGARLVSEGRAMALVSAGNTGATMATAMMQWKRLPGVSRPAITAVFPHPFRPVVLLDVGANVDCKPRQLLHFAVMGSVYSRLILQRRKPRVGILSVGEEDTKGNELVFAARELLRQAPIQFGGNAEGRDLFAGNFDVVVCDGFVGNICLKLSESLVRFLTDNMKGEVSRNPISMMGAFAMIPAYRSFKRKVDHEEYGGLPLLGLQGTCIICHGSARAKSVKNALRVAANMVHARVNHHIVKAMQETEAALAGGAPAAS